VKAIETGASSKRVINVPLGAPFSEPGFGTTYSTITFVVSNSSQSLDASYSFTSSGSSGSAVELKWDETEPVGYLPLVATDSLCVIFDAIAGAKLDSIRIALRRAGTMMGGVWAYTGVSRPSPLGTPLAFPITASTALTPSVINPGGPYPYEQPYPNWRTIDLRSYNIKTDNSFAVGFWLRDPATDALVLVTKHVNGDFYHSFTFSNGSSGRNWYYFTAQDGTTYLYLIRAYVSSGVTGVQETYEVLPTSFSLAQNYPNPFNPSTTIQYTIPRRSQVRLKVFDTMGREVATIIDQELNAGVYKSVWNGKDHIGVTVSSGVYFYRLEANGYQSTQKMVLLK
ncbi:MAG: T9SS type A sorting domain-containing protein, partial [Ignavibacteriales bacterium]|nr:T9SS type A sorting domain-containing protein [Ignavibacteriales bacterium]